MSGSLVQNTSHTSATVTVAGGRKLEITRVIEASLQTPQGLIQVKRVLQVPELGYSSLVSWQKQATEGFTMHREGETIQIRMN